MMNLGNLAGKTLFITGTSREMGKAIALKAAKRGANVVYASKTALPYFKVPGTMYTTVKESNKNLTLDSFLDFDTSSSIFKNYSQKMGTRLMSTQAGDGVDVIFNAIKGKLNTDIVNSVQAVYHFNLTGGEEEITYHIDLKNGKGSAGRGKSAATPDAVLTMKTENFNKMFQGKLKPTSAFMTGKLKISGNMQKALKLEKLFTALKANM